MKLPRKFINPIEETVPEWRGKFLSYKDLKKKLKSIVPKAGAETRTEARDIGMTDKEIDFVRLLEKEMEKLNSFFVEKEEEFIIQMKILQERIAKAKDSKSNEDHMLKEIKKEVEDLHEQMVMLEKFIALNYTGLAKIIKKYDRRTGGLIRLPSIQRVLQQPPFFNTDLLHKLVGECEAMLDRLFPKHVTEDQDPSSLVGKIADRPNKPGKECPDPMAASIPASSSTEK